MTEICHAYQAGTPSPMNLPRTDFEDGDFWGNQIVSDLEAGASAWIYWNMILDENGGPWLVSPVHGNPDPNVQHPVVIIDRKTKPCDLHRGLHLPGPFQQVRPPGIDPGGHDPGRAWACAVIAFQTPERGLVVQLLNSGEQPARTRISARASGLELSASRLCPSPRPFGPTVPEGLFLVSGKEHGMFSLIPLMVLGSAALSSAPNAPRQAWNRGVRGCDRSRGLVPGPSSTSSRACAGRPNGDSAAGKAKSLEGGTKEFDHHVQKCSASTEPGQRG